MKDPIRVTTLTRIWRELRRKISRNEWAVWLLGLRRSENKPTDRGLILIQIDGLPRKQLERAMAENRMPFLNSLILKEHFELHDFYSGLPASTPSVQGELYYGVKTIVPAFGFRDHKTGHLVRMFAGDVAREKEQILSNSATGLLTGGSSYCNNYGGGAKEVHFCATSFGWDEFFATINPFRLIMVLLLNFWMFFRVAGLMIIEFFSASWDFIRGIISGQRFWQELIMIPARVIVVVLLRELVTTGACYDATRGLPIIHVNLLGYDEHAHRRGPDSRYAHWSLDAIDRSIKRIWTAAHRGAGREYDVWIFSDHGQEATTPYEETHGKLIQQVVAETIDTICESSSCQTGETKPTVRVPSRANWLGVGLLVSMLFGEQDYDMQSRSENVQTATSGPLGFVYFLNRSLDSRKSEIAAELVNTKNVPMVGFVDGESTKVVSKEGVFELPRDAIQVFGADHPFLDDIGPDLKRLLEHADSGDLILIGWTHEQESVSFVLQNGAHAGPGIEETRGFALLPCDAPIAQSKKRYLRPNDLRKTALRFMGRSKGQSSFKSQWTPAAAPMRLVTYNVHACVGMDGQLSSERIARVISQTGANIVCLQELDVFRNRSGNQDQAHEIAKHLEMEFHFHPAWHIEEEKFGNAILTRFPVRIVKGTGLHHYKDSRSRRSALWVEIELDEQTTVQVISTHMSIFPKEQLLQAQELLDDWVAPASELGPVILCGDFNARPASAAYKLLSRHLWDVESFNSNPGTPPTYFSPLPFTRLDHIFLSDGLTASSSCVVDTRLAKVASDHLPLMADIKPKPDAFRKSSNSLDSYQRR